MGASPRPTGNHQSKDCRKDTAISSNKDETNATFKNVSVNIYKNPAASRDNKSQDTQRPESKTC